MLIWSFGANSQVANIKKNIDNALKNRTLTVKACVVTF